MHKSKRKVTGPNPPTVRAKPGPEQLREQFDELTRLRDLALSEGRSPWWQFCTVVQEVKSDGETVAVFLQCALCPKKFSALRHRAVGSEHISGGYGNCAKLNKDVRVQATVLEAFGDVQDNSEQKATSQMRQPSRTCRQSLISKCKAIHCNTSCPPPHCSQFFTKCKCSSWKGQLPYHTQPACGAVQSTKEACTDMQPTSCRSDTIALSSCEDRRIKAVAKMLGMEPLCSKVCTCSFCKGHIWSAHEPC